MCRRKKSPRRGRGKGTLFQKSKKGKRFGNYYALVSVYDAATDKMVRKAYATGTDNREEAERFLADLIDKNHLDGACVKPTAADGGKVSKAKREAVRKRQAFLDGLRESTDSNLYRMQELQKEREAAEAQSRKEAEQAERDAKAITIDSAFIYYRTSGKRPDSSPATLRTYESQYAIFAEWVKKSYPEVTLIRDISPEMAEAFLAHLGKNRSRATRNKYLVFLRSFWRVLRWNPDAQLAIDPWEGIRTLNATSDTVVHRDITVDEMERTVKTIDADGITPPLAFNGKDLRHEFRLLFAVGFYTGLRLGDCATLAWESIDLALNTIAVYPRKTKRLYNRKITTSIHPILRDILMTAPRSSRRGYLMPVIADIYLNHERSMITNRVQAIFRAAGITTEAKRPAESNGTKGRVEVGFHSLRHFFASYLDSHGVNHAITNYLTCHEQGKVEARYYHENREAIESAIRILPNLAALSPSEALATPAESALPAPANDATPLAPAKGTDEPKGHLHAFYEVLDKMDDTELKQALQAIKERLGKSGL